MSRKKVGTHNGVFHADDVFAVATIALAEGERPSVVRTRDEAILDSCDVVVDVGGVLDPAAGRFDHHQRGVEARDNGCPYSSFGLVWKKYGPAMCGTAVASAVDAALVQAVDAVDNGETLYEGGVPKFAGASGASVSMAISSLNPTWDEEGGFDAAFDTAVTMAMTLLERAIASAKSVENARSYVRSAVHKSGALATNSVVDIEDRPIAWARGRIVVLDRFCPWQEVVVEEAPDAKYVVFLAEDDTWRVQVVPKELGKHEARRDLPEAWAGLRDADLAELSGVEDSIFCHLGRFIAGAKTRHGALKLATLALKS